MGGKRTMIPTRLNSESRKLQAISAKATQHSKTVQGKKVKEPLEPSFTESFDSSPKAADDEYLNVFNKGSYKNMIEKHIVPRDRTKPSEYIDEFNQIRLSSQFIGINHGSLHAFMESVWNSGVPGFRRVQSGVRDLIFVVHQRSSSTTHFLKRMVREPREAWSHQAIFKKGPFLLIYN